MKCILTLVVSTTLLATLSTTFASEDNEEAIDILGHRKYATRNELNHVKNNLIDRIETEAERRRHAIKVENGRRIEAINLEAERRAAAIDEVNDLVLRGVADRNVLRVTLFRLMDQVELLTASVEAAESALQLANETISQQSEAIETVRNSSRLNTILLLQQNSQIGTLEQQVAEIIPALDGLENNTALINELNQRVENNQGSISENQGSINEQTGVIEGLAERIERIDQPNLDFSTIDLRLDNLEGGLSVIGELANNVGNNTTNIENQSQRLSLINTRLARIDIPGLDYSQINPRLNQLEMTDANLNQSLSDLSTNIIGLQSGLVSQGESIAGVQQRLDVIQVPGLDFNTLNPRLSTVEASIAAKSNELEALATTVNTNKNDLTSQGESIVILDGRLEAIETVGVDFSNINPRFNGLEGSIELNNARLTQLSASVTATQNALVNASQGIATIGRRLNNIAVPGLDFTTINPRLDSLETQTAEIGALGTAVSNNSNLLATQQTSINSLFEEIAAIEIPDVDFTAINTRVDDIEKNSVLDLDGYLSLELDERGVATALFRGINIQLVSNGFSTEEMDGSGNLIIGFNESNSLMSSSCDSSSVESENDCFNDNTPWEEPSRLGSHNLIIGQGNHYEGFGEIIRNNQVLDQAVIESQMEENNNSLPQDEYISEY